MPPLALSAGVDCSLPTQVSTLRLTRTKVCDVVFTPRGNWHGYVNTSDEDVLLIWGWSGAGSLDAAGYDLP